MATSTDAATPDASAGEVRNHRWDFNLADWSVVEHDEPAVGEVLRLVDLDPTAGWVYATVTAVRPARSAYSWIASFDVDWDSFQPWPPFGDPLVADPSPAS